MREKLKITFTDDTEELFFIEVNSFIPFAGSYICKKENGNKVYIPYQKVKIAEINQIEE